MPPNTVMMDHLEIREAIDNWVLWRDAGEWDRFATIWSPEGRMATTWSQSTFTEFIHNSRQAKSAGLRVLHLLGGSTIDVAFNRAIAQTKMQILQRARVHDVLVDVVCYGRFWDAFEKSNEGWRLVRRQPIYDMDRMSPVDPAAKLQLDGQLLASFPDGYQHLAYVQTHLGLQVSRTMPVTDGPEIEALRERGRLWLAGGGVECLD